MSTLREEIEFILSPPPDTIYPFIDQVAMIEKACKQWALEMVGEYMDTTPLSTDTLTGIEKAQYNRAKQEIRQRIEEEA